MRKTAKNRARTERLLLEEGDLKKVGVKKGQDLGGVRDFEGLRQRSVIDEVTGCWNVRANQNRGSMSLWCPLVQDRVTLTALIGILKTGAKMPNGKLWIPTCGNTKCGNPLHRKLGTRGEYWAIIRPELTLEHKGKIAKARREKKLSRYCPKLKAEILSSPENHKDLADRLGFHPSAIRKIRQGTIWKDSAQNSSVFNWRPAA